MNLWTRPAEVVLMLHLTIFGANRTIDQLGLILGHGGLDAHSSHFIDNAALWDRIC